jgi:hypothetical protein
MNDKNLGKRPIIISIICICAAFFVVVTAIALVFSSGARSYVFANMLMAPSNYVGLLSAFINLIALIGYWKMRKWGVYLYAVGIVVSVLFGLIDKSFSFGSLILSIVVVGIGLLYFKRMS